MEKNKFDIVVFLKGILMGICDLIPGISGGTVAFITGIYERLINSVKGFSPSLLILGLSLLFKKDSKKIKDFKKGIKKIEFGFLISLFIGIAVALIIGSRIIEYFLENHLAYTFSFFIGLIIASSKIIYNEIENHEHFDRLFLVIGFIIGVILTIITPLVVVNPSLNYIFLGGVFAISAMFLPGISGAFILLIMGIYEFMIHVLRNLGENLGVFLVFGVGAAVGMFIISRVISYLFNWDKSKTLYVLLGLVIGSLSIPIRRVIDAVSFDIGVVALLIFWFLLGVFLVVVVGSINKRD